MAYSKEVVIRARERLATMKADKESLTQQRLAEAYRQIPRLREIDRLLRQTMAATIQAAFSKGEDMHAAMEQVKQENLRLQQERRELIEANFRLGWLDEEPVCPHCGGNDSGGGRQVTWGEAPQKVSGLLFKDRDLFLYRGGRG